MNNPPDQEPIPLDAYADARPALKIVTPDAEGLAPQPLSDDHLADCFIRMHGQDWRYVARWGKWYFFDGDGWREDAKDAVMGAAKGITRAALSMAAAKPLTGPALKKVNSVRQAKDLLIFARSDADIAATVDQWDVDGYLLGVPGGVVDLRLGKDLEAVREHYITKRCTVAPASGRPELWLKFLETCTGGDTSVRDYLQRFAGYCLTGETVEQMMMFFYGLGANGKSTFLQVLTHIMGDYAVSGNIDTFMEQKNPAHSTELARLNSARLVVVEETTSGGRWSEGKIKKLTGGGKIAAHFMRQDDFEFEPKFKLLVAGNHKPVIKSVGEAMRRRLHIVPFLNIVPEADRDPELLNKLKAEAPQILSWMIDGCLAWQDCRLGKPEAVEQAIEDYLQQEDTIGAWLEECCERKSSGVTSGAVLYKNYQDWCETQGETIWSKKALSTALLELGFTQVRSETTRSFKGLVVKVAPSYSDIRG